MSTARAALDADNAAIQRVQQECDALQARIATLRQQQVDQGLHATLAAAERELVTAEEAAVRDIAIELAGDIVKRQASDPVHSHPWIAEKIATLRTMVRSELDTPRIEKYGVHPVITQALALLPPTDPMDRPVFELGYVQSGLTDWPTRRRAILAAHSESTPPLEAA